MLLSDVCLTSDVCLMSVTYIGPNSRTERPMGTEGAHVNRTPLSGSKGQRSSSPGRFGWLLKSLHNVYRRDQSPRHRPERAAACRSWIFMAQGVLGAEGV